MEQTGVYAVQRTLLLSYTCTIGRGRMQPRCRQAGQSPSSSAPTQERHRAAFAGTGQQEPGRVQGRREGQVDGNVSRHGQSRPGVVRMSSGQEVQPRGRRCDGGQGPVRPLLLQVHQGVGGGPEKRFVWSPGQRRQLSSGNFFK